MARRVDLIFDERSIFWFRGYVESDSLASQLDQVLDDYGAQLHVVAHTPVPTIESRYDGRILAVDLEVAASELLLLVKEPEGGYGRWKIGLEGPPELIPLTPPGPR